MASRLLGGWRGRRKAVGGLPVLSVKVDKGEHLELAVSCSLFSMTYPAVLLQSGEELLRLGSGQGLVAAVDAEISG